MRRSKENVDLLVILNEFMLFIPLFHAIARLELQGDAICHDIIVPPEICIFVECLLCLHCVGGRTLSKILWHEIFIQFDDSVHT